MTGHILTGHVGSLPARPTYVRLGLGGLEARLEV